MSAQRGCLPFGRGCLPSGVVCPIACWDTPLSCEQNNTGVKTLPCPKLHLRVVNIGFILLDPDSDLDCNGHIAIYRTFYHSKRSLGQGNIFTRVCHSIHKGRGLASWLPSMHHRSHDYGVCMRGVGQKPLPQVCLQGGGLGRSTPVQIHGILRDMVNKLAVASYWNAFLLKLHRVEFKFQSQLPT